MIFSVKGNWQPWKWHFHGRIFPENPTNHAPPIRVELLSAEQMRQYGQVLAQSHKLETRWAPNHLLARLADNEHILLVASRRLTESMAEDRHITPAGEWLLDNFYLIEEQIRTARRHLPKGYSRELPRLKQGPSAGLPRVYDIALEAISHADGRVDPESLSGFVAAYQSVAVLKLGELWAIPIMLRLALIENLRRVAARMTTAWTAREQAASWAEQMATVAKEDPKSLILITADMARANPPMVSAFIAELAHRLQRLNLTLPLTWIEQRLSESNSTIEQVIHSENQQQAADQVSISNSIGGLRVLGSMDWRQFVEKVSTVEQILCEDPASIYSNMEFATRDQYRRQVEVVAKRCHLTEAAVARHAITLAQLGQSSLEGDQRTQHVGYYLIDKGLQQLEPTSFIRGIFYQSPQQAFPGFSLFLYLGAIACLTALGTVGLAGQAHADKSPQWEVILVAIVAALCASEVATRLVNWFVTLVTIPHILPRMDFSNGIPSEAHTLVVVPSMLTSVEAISDLVESLEVRFLANRDEHLRFGLLTDLMDASEETQPEDATLVRLAQEKIEALNTIYGTSTTTPFFLLHRARRYNPSERKWMGYERKRGKLAALNTLLLGGKPQSDFALIIGNLAEFSPVRYVITLDADTQLPRDSARQLVGTMAHPLNRAHFDESAQRVTAGYGILQPRMAENLSGNRSLYARLWGSEPGLDPYTRAVSDVYQDLFQEGSFIGKGIYEVATFARATNAKFPENRILSHDLLEGCYARSGLLSDIQLYEAYPSNYSVDVSRRHRWIRGDWQIARWVLPHVPGPVQKSSRQRNPLSYLSRWKILDNLRRSLVPIAEILLLLLGWSILPHPWMWTMVVLAVFIIHPITTLLVNLLRCPKDMSLKQHWKGAFQTASTSFAQVGFTFACLPYEAFFSFDAIVRTAFRILIHPTRRLEWNLANNKKTPIDLGTMIRTMFPCPVLALGMAFFITHFRSEAVAAASPVLFIWFLGPVLAFLFSLPLQRRDAKFSSTEIRFLRKIARKTWDFFDTFVGAKDRWLPPDNMQEVPSVTVAHRTSPTNMGLSLLANLTAHDLGYISTGKLLERTSHALHTMATLERYRGHFYNWYETTSGKPLRPYYVSSVDSGNLAGTLLVLRQGLLSLIDQEIVNPNFFSGCLDTLALARESVADVTRSRLDAIERVLQKALDEPAHTLVDWQHALEAIALAVLAMDEELASQPTSPAKRWINALNRQCQDARADLRFITPWISQPSQPDRLNCISRLSQIPTLGELSQRAQKRIAVIKRLALRAGELANMEYDFLYDPKRHLIAIGYNVDERRRDLGTYDLLASEARLTTFVGIAQGQLPQESWFAMGRQLTRVGGRSILLSWSGSMFEYLMPMLIMPHYEGTLLDETCQNAVRRQMDYGAELGVPWGISESGYHFVDAHQQYQYRAFGVPGLGLKRGLAEDLVIAPYASVLALMVMPKEACANLRRLAASGCEGDYGFYEAIDFTPSRLPRGQTNAVIRSFMAHHQGMSLLSLSNVLLKHPMQKRFTADPAIAATTLLLQERIPKTIVPFVHTSALALASTTQGGIETPLRIFDTPHTFSPQVQLLSNGRYHVMITNSGGGYSRWNDMAITRWREDSTCDDWGSFCYLRDVVSGKFWSTAFQPTRMRMDSYQAIFSESRAEFRCRVNGIDTHTEIAVSPEDDVELRRITLTNRSRKHRMIDLTSYAEVVLALPATDIQHPGFSNLFVQTEILCDRQAILCTRRRRSIGESPLWMFHLMAVHGSEPLEISYETDRSRFIGRGHTLSDPQVMEAGGTLSDSQGSVLDPIVAIRQRINLEPDAIVTINIVTGIGEARDTCLGLVDKYKDRQLADRVFDLAWTHSQVALRQIHATEADAQLFSRLAGNILFANASWRADPSLVKKNRRGQSGLWGYSISGDLPIVLLRIVDQANLNLVQLLVQAHAYWRRRGLKADLVIWNEDHSGYRQVLHEQIMKIIAAAGENHVTDRPDGIFVRSVDQIADEDRILLLAVARAVLSDDRGSLADQIDEHGSAERTVPPPLALRSHRAESVHVPKHIVGPRPDLRFFNGSGGFTPDGREYVITTIPGRMTPAPWVNVLANPHFGTILSESGAAYTWAGNAHEFRLTPWHNDPVSDGSGEALFLRDEDSGHFWSPTPLPSQSPSDRSTVTRHGFGYSVFEHRHAGIHSELWIYVDANDPVKFSVLKIRNDSGHARRLSATAYVEWVLGDIREKTAPHVITNVDPGTGAIFARNFFSTDFSEQVAFLDVDGPISSLTGDRTEFLGRNGSLRNPAAMSRVRLSGKTGATLDPCAAIQIFFDLIDGQEREIVFRLGVGTSIEHAASLIHHHRGPGAARAALELVWSYWNHTLGAVQVETPDPAVNLLANGWLLYQTLACRLWARSGFYQSGGAFGFRDQLQDTMALLHAEPRLLREQLLLCAAHQFREGDVQHWWHPPSSRGVRTRCSDDFLWLALATCRYTLGTGDTGVLDEVIPFLDGRTVNAEEDSYYDLPRRSKESATLYEHCTRAILRGLNFGIHGLPLIGTGDWNDGMNCVGALGKGESVWLAFFLFEVLQQFAELGQIRGDVVFVERCRNEATKIRLNIEESGWDGAWYRRAFFDDGTLLGSSGSPECQIDSIAQSWSVLSKAANPERTTLAMEALDQRLVRRSHSLVQLLDPPFDKSNLEPGYIKGYVPGVRENGGQYTHAAIWAAMAFAAKGDSLRAWEIFGLINPINHTKTAEGVQTYKVEPYVMAADVYAVAPHIGRGGWTWYTGSAGWMYRLILESLLGIELSVNKLRLTPCLPAGWEGFRVHYRYRETVYHIQVTRMKLAEKVMTVIVDGVEQQDLMIPLSDDRQQHTVILYIPDSI